jgi:hypothetical protein
VELNNATVTLAFAFASARLMSALRSGCPFWPCGPCVVSRKGTAQPPNLSHACIGWRPSALDNVRVWVLEACSWLLNHRSWAALWPGYSRSQQRLAGHLMTGKPHEK